MNPQDDVYQQLSKPPKTKVCLVGSGNWGSAIATIVGRNCARLPFCDTQVNMWVYEEDIELTSPDGTHKIKEKLSHLINQRHENVKYLPGIPLPTNIHAIPDLAEACRGATLLIFVLPHQFLPKLIPVIRQHVHPSCRGISLIKGLDFDHDTHTPVQISQTIAQTMGSPFRCGVLMGANVADEVARGEFCESTLACDFHDDEINEATRQIFHDEDTFRVQHCRDVAGAEVCGALKNVVALGAGFIDGLGLGGNTKAALLRIGLLEMMAFAQTFFQDRGGGVQPSTFWQSCGMADLVTTCFGGRNRKCAAAFAAQQVGTDKHSSARNSPDECRRLWSNIETELLQGQKLQGTLTAKEVYQVLRGHNLVKSFPLSTTIYQIAFEGRPVRDIVQAIRVPSSRL
mmetsp:Transcript_16443/g.33177  ORF Transcript_16443/g.33177 Transcript_16443/m.33177 type:complete len:400 (+) Transcript_16443:388-1587(+)